MGRFEAAATRYQYLFKTTPPVHEHGFWPTPEQALAMIERANKRGTPITDDDYPKEPAGRDY